MPGTKSYHSWTPPASSPTDRTDQATGLTARTTQPNRRRGTTQPD